MPKMTMLRVCGALFVSALGLTPLAAHADRREARAESGRALAGQARYEVLWLEHADWNGDLVVWVHDGSRAEPSADALVEATQRESGARPAVVLLRVAPDALASRVSEQELQALAADFGARFGAPTRVVLSSAIPGRHVVLAGGTRVETDDVTPIPNPLPIECGQACSRLVFERKLADCSGTIEITGGLECLNPGLYFAAEWAACVVPNYNVACPARCVCSETHSTIESTVCATLAAGTRTNGNCKMTWTGTMTISIESAVTHGTCKPATGTPLPH